jgi:hypothetical protein
MEHGFAIGQEIATLEDKQPSLFLKLRKISRLNFVTSSASRVRRDGGGAA